MSASAVLERSRHEHSVQFYENADALLERAGRFLAAGLTAGDASVIIATEPHRRGLEERLIAGGVDLAAARAEGRYLALDAEETLSKFMVGSEPDARAFNEV